MSVEIMTAVFNADGLTSTQKLVLLSLADHASEDGMNVYPGVKRLMIKTSLSERTIRRTLSEFRNNKILRVERKSTRYKPTEYSIDLPALQISRHPDLLPVPVRPARDAPLKPPDLPESSDRPARDAPKSSVNHQKDINHQLIKKNDGKTPPSPSPKNQVRKALELYFVERTKLPSPKMNTNRQQKAAGTKWWGPLREIAELTEWDEGTGKELINQAIIRLNGLTISDPNSILKTAKAVWSEKQRQSPLHVTHPPYKAGDPLPGQ